MMQTLAAVLSADARAMDEQLRMWYHDLHRIPEMAHKEFKTHAYIRKQLDLIGAAYLTPAENITVAVICGEMSGPVVGMRFDTDALLVEEQTGLPFASEHKGVMHACGHDGHTAVGLGCAALLKKYAAKLQGTVKLIFQPAEEGENGADLVLETGLVDDVEQFFGLHFWSAYPRGHLCAAPVTTSAAVNMLDIRIHGRGGHGAMPHVCRDALVAGAEIVCALQTVVSRTLPPTSPALLTVGSFHAGTQGNIIAGEARMLATLRTVCEEDRCRAEEAIAAIVQNIASMHGCDAEISDRRMSDPVVNAPDLVEIARTAADTVIGCFENELPGLCIGNQRTMMTGDDFANYGSVAPYVYMQLGIADAARGTDHPLHSPFFRLDEDMLSVGLAWMVLCAPMREQD